MLGLNFEGLEDTADKSLVVGEGPPDAIIILSFESRYLIQLHFGFQSNQRLLGLDLKSGLVLLNMFYLRITYITMISYVNTTFKNYVPVWCMLKCKIHTWVIRTEKYLGDLENRNGKN